MPLIDKVDGYNIVYKWFDYLKAQGRQPSFVPTLQIIKRKGLVF